MPQVYCKKHNSTPRLEVGRTIICQCSADKNYHLAEILLKKPAEGDEEERYYVHYLNFPTRLDEWVKIDSFDLDGEKDVCDDTERKTRSQRKQDTERLEGILDPQTMATRQAQRHDERIIKNIELIYWGYDAFYEMNAWYYSPYPEEYIGSTVKKLLICEYCLKYFPNKQGFSAHKEFCYRRHPPGVEIYHYNGITIYEVDGHQDKVYCQCLCLLARLFLEHKTLCFDVECFMFYVMTNQDHEGHHIVGYFSKEKVCALGYNLACILVLPPWQKCGYGRGLIQLSYELSRRTNSVGTPERPLSDLGLRGYFSYWKYTLLSELRKLPRKSNVSISELAARSAIKPEDVVYTLRRLNLLVTSFEGQHFISIPPDFLQSFRVTPPQFELSVRHLVWPVEGSPFYRVSKIRGGYSSLEYYHQGSAFPEGRKRSLASTFTAGAANTTATAAGATSATTTTATTATADMNSSKHRK